MRHRRRGSLLRGLGDLSTDRAFDALLPVELRHLSRVHWTPIDVAIRVATLLAPKRDTRILDIGAGVGKLCLVGAMSSTATWVGIERHEACAIAAERLARDLGITTQTRFFHGDVFGMDWDEFDALYLYNPFELKLFSETVGPDDPLEYLAQIGAAEDRLARMRVGTRVVTLNGFGGVMPASYQLLSCERVVQLGVDLVVWIQRAARGAISITLN
jgi:hypothetical protein